MHKAVWNIPRLYGIVGKAPTPRWGHTTTYVVRQKKERFLFVFGGWDGINSLNDCYYYSIDEHVWIQPEIKGIVPEKRSGHTICNIGTVSKNKLLLIGGEGKDYLRSLWLFDVKTDRWSLKKVTSSHKVYIKDDLLINERYIQKVSDVDGKRVKKVSTKTTTTTKENSPVEENSNMYLGNHTVQLEDTGFGTPSKIKLINDKIKVKEKMVFPATRTRHTCSVVGDRIFMFGGGGMIEQKYKVFNDLWILDLKKWEWSKPKTVGRVDAIWGHTATRYKKYIYFFAGCHYKIMMNELFRLNTETFEWDHLKIDSPILPAPRAAHSSVLYESFLVILWGGDNNNFLDDLFFIDLEQLVCKRMNFEKPVSRCAHTATMVDNFMYVLGGGRDETKRFKELYAVDIEFTMKKLRIERRPRKIMKRKEKEEEGEKEKLKFVDVLKKNVVKSNGANSETNVVEDKKNGEKKEKKKPNVLPPAPPLPGDEREKDREKEKEREKKKVPEAKDFLPIMSEVKVNESYDSGKKRKKEMTRTIVKKQDLFKKKFDEEDEIYLPITNWLVSKGLKKYVKTFLQNEIDLESLPLMSEEDLIGIGVNKIGPRKKILNEIKHMKKDKKHGNNSGDVENLKKSIARLNRSMDEMKDIIRNGSMYFQNPYTNFNYQNQQQYPYYQQQPYFQGNPQNQNRQYNQAPPVYQQRPQGGYSPVFQQPPQQPQQPPMRTPNYKSTNYKGRNNRNDGRKNDGRKNERYKKEKDEKRKKRKNSKIAKKEESWFEMTEEDEETKTKDIR